MADASFRPALRAASVSRRPVGPKGSQRAPPSHPPCAVRRPPARSTSPGGGARSRAASAPNPLDRHGHREVRPSLPGTQIQTLAAPRTIPCTASKQPWPVSPDAHHFQGFAALAQSSRCTIRPLAAGSELGDELLGLVQLAAQPVALLGRALRERLAPVSMGSRCRRRRRRPCGATAASPRTGSTRATAFATGLVRLRP